MTNWEKFKEVFGLPENSKLKPIGTVCLFVKCVSKDCTECPILTQMYIEYIFGKMNMKARKTMMTIGDFKRHDKVIFQGKTYEILGIGNRSFNNVQCQNIATKNRKWLDVDTEVSPYCENLWDTNLFNDERFGG